MPRIIVWTSCWIPCYRKRATEREKKSSARDATLIATSTQGGQGRWLDACDRFHADVEN